MEERFAELRALLAQPPSERVWESLTTSFDDWPPEEDIELAVSYAQEHLAHWPDTLRKAPALWLFQMAPEDADQWSTEELEDYTEDELDALRERFEHPAPHPAWPLVRSYRGEWPYYDTHFFDPYVLAHLTSLEICALGGNADYASVSGLKLNHLKTLRFKEGTHSLDEEAAEYFVDADMPELEELDFGGQLDGPSAFSSWLELPDFSGVTVLNVDGCGLNDQSMSALVQMVNPPLLKSLNIRANRAITFEGFRTLLYSPLCEELEHLVISLNDRIGSEGVRLLLKTPTPTRYRTLGMRDIGLSDDDVIAIIRSPKLQGVEWLELACNRSNAQSNEYFGGNLSDKALQAIATSPHMSQLQYLDLSENNITDKGLEALAHSPHLSQLKYLHLGETKVNMGLLALAHSQSITQLQKLNLGGCALDAKNVAAFLASPNLGHMSWLLLDLLAETQTEEPLLERAICNNPALGQMREFLCITGYVVEKAGARLLADAQHLGQLERMCLTMTPEAEQILKNAPHLQEVNIFQNQS